jgi:hypothetical protein
MHTHSLFIEHVFAKHALANVIEPMYILNITSILFSGVKINYYQIKNFEFLKKKEYIASIMLSHVSNTKKIKVEFLHKIM